MGFLAPPANAPWYIKARGFVIILLLVIVLLALGFGIVKLVSLPFGGAAPWSACCSGIVVIARSSGSCPVRAPPTGDRPREGARRSGRLTCAGATRWPRLTRRACVSASRSATSVPVARATTSRPATTS
jgi:hypothetical protein